MMAPYLEMEVIRQLASSRTTQSREILVENSEVPSFRNLRKSLNKLKAAG
jgi:hypothetical protein